MLYDLSIMSERKVYVIQEIAGTKAGTPKINIVGASEYGDFIFVLPEFSQMIHSPGPLVYTLRKKLNLPYLAAPIIFIFGLPNLVPGISCMT